MALAERKKPFPLGQEEIARAMENRVAQIEANRSNGRPLGRLIKSDAFLGKLEQHLAEINHPVSPEAAFPVTQPKMLTVFQHSASRPTPGSEEAPISVPARRTTVLSSERPEKEKISQVLSHLREESRKKKVPLEALVYRHRRLIESLVEEASLDAPRDPARRKFLEVLAAPTLLFAVAASIFRIGTAVDLLRRLGRRENEETAVEPVQPYQPFKEPAMAEVEKEQADIIARQPQVNDSVGGEVATQADDRAMPDVQTGPDLTTVSESVPTRVTAVTGQEYSTVEGDTVWNLMTEAKLVTNPADIEAFCAINKIDGCPQNPQVGVGQKFYIPSQEEIERKKRELAASRVPVQAEATPAATPGPEPEITFNVVSQDLQVQEPATSVVSSESEESEESEEVEGMGRTEEEIILPSWLVTDEEKIHQWIDEHFLPWAQAVERGEDLTLEVIVPVNFIPGLEGIQSPQIIKGPLVLEVETKGLFGRKKMRTFTFPSVPVAVFRGFPLSTTEAEVSLHGALGKPVEEGGRGLYNVPDSFSGHRAYVFRPSEFSPASLAFIYRDSPPRKWVMSGEVINPNGILKEPAQLLVVAYKRPKDGLIERFYPLVVKRND